MGGGCLGHTAQSGYNKDWNISIVGQHCIIKTVLLMTNDSHHTHIYWSDGTGEKRHCFDLNQFSVHKSVGTFSGSPNNETFDYYSVNEQF